MKKPTELEEAALVQADQVGKGEARAAELRGQLEVVRAARGSMRDDLDALEAETARLMAESGPRALADAEDDLARFEPTPEERARIEQELPRFEELRTLSVEEGSFRAELLRYATEERVRLDDDPIAALLPPNRLREVRGQWNASVARLPWDDWDYGLVGAAATVGALFDIALVSVPPGSVWKGVKYAGSPLTKALRNTAEWPPWLKRLQQALEQWAKVSYDLAINNKRTGIDVAGLRPKMHRLMSPAQDPVLGLFQGVVDLMRGTCTLIDRFGVQRVIVTAPGIPFAEALCKVMAHFLSDIPTTMGLPTPFFSALQFITAKTPFSATTSGPGLSGVDLARVMYSNGYEFRHFMTMGIVPALIETVVRVGFWARNRDAFGASDPAAPNLVRKRAELLGLAHAVTASTNAMKVALMQGNPLAINQAVWMALPAVTVNWLRVRAAHETAVQEALVRGWQVTLAGIAR